MPSTLLIGYTIPGIVNESSTDECQPESVVHLYSMQAASLTIAIVWILRYLQHDHFPSLGKSPLVSDADRTNQSWLAFLGHTLVDIPHLLRQVWSWSCSSIMNDPRMNDVLAVADLMLYTLIIAKIAQVFDLYTATVGIICIVVLLLVLNARGHSSFYLMIGARVIYEVIAIGVPITEWSISSIYECVCSNYKSILIIMHDRFVMIAFVFPVLSAHLLHDALEMQSFVVLRVHRLASLVRIGATEMSIIWWTLFDCNSVFHAHVLGWISTLFTALVLSILYVYQLWSGILPIASGMAILSYSISYWKEISTLTWCEFTRYISANIPYLVGMPDTLRNAYCTSVKVSPIDMYTTLASNAQSYAVAVDGLNTILVDVAVFFGTLVIGVMPLGKLATRSPIPCTSIYAQVLLMIALANSEFVRSNSVTMSGLLAGSLPLVIAFIGTPILAFIISNIAEWKFTPYIIRASIFFETVYRYEMRLIAKIVQPIYKSYAFIMSFFRSVKQEGAQKLVYHRPRPHQ